MPIWANPTSGGGGGGVLSVAGKTGNVVLVIADVGGLQLALEGKAAEVHGHAIADVAGLQLALEGKAAEVHGHDDRYYTKSQVDTAIGEIELTPGPAGPQGPAGSDGATGPAGPGVPVGGSTGQVLAKASNADYHTQWVAPGGGGELPSGGTTAHYLRGDASWQALDVAAVSGLVTALGTKASNDDLSLLLGAVSNLDAEVTGLQESLDGKAPASHGHAIADVTDLGSTLSSHSSSIGTLNGQVNGLQTDLSNHTSSSLMHLPSSPSDGVLYYNGSNWGTIAASWVSIDDENSSTYTTYSSNRINSLISGVNDSLNGKANLAGGNTFAGQQTLNALLVVNGPAGAIPTDTILSVGTGFFVRKDGSILAPMIVGQPKWDDVANLASSGAATWDMDQTPVAILNISGAVTLTISNPRKRGTYILRVKNAAAGPYTITWSGTTIVWLPGGTAPTLPTGADKRMVVTLVYDGTELLGIATVQS